MKVLRLGHRAGRDNRISTHVALTARQWGAEEVIYSGEKDSNMIESVKDTADRWGGSFGVSYTDEPARIVKDFDGAVTHLTMYGEPLDNLENELEEDFSDQDVLVIVGAEKVDRKFYRLADYNIGVGNQPHSEIAALAVFLDRFYPIKEDFEDAEIRVKPSEDSKKTEKI